MTGSREAFVGIDAAKLRNAVAVAEAGREGEVRYIGEFDASPDEHEAVHRQVGIEVRAAALLLRGRPDRVRAAPSDHRTRPRVHGGGALAHSPEAERPCEDQPPRRDHTGAAVPAGELTAVWVPDPAHEALRNLIRCRTAAVETVKVHKQQVRPSCCAMARIFPRRKTWGARTGAGCSSSISNIRPIRSCCRSMSRRSGSPRSVSFASSAPSPSSCPDGAWRRCRGVAGVARGRPGGRREFRRRDRRHSPVQNPRQLMGYLGLVPAERSTGESVRRGLITKMGNPRIRQLLVEARGRTGFRETVRNFVRGPLS